MTATNAPPSQTGRAALWMIGVILAFSAMALAGRAVSLELDTFEIMLFRSLIGIAVVCSVVLTLRIPVTFRHLGLHSARNLAHFTGQNLWFYAVAVAPMAQVFALEFTSPIWALMLAPVILGERITRRGLIAASLGFLGILIVTRPGMLTLTPGLAAAAASAIGFGLTALFTRRLTRTENVASILLMLVLMQAVLGAICAGYDGDVALPSLSALPFVVVIAICGLVAHLCLTQALSLAPASQVMPIDFARLPLIAVLGMAFYGEALDIWVFAGGALIVAANWFNLRRQ